MRRRKRVGRLAAIGVLAIGLAGLGPGAESRAAGKVVAMLVVDTDTKLAGLELDHAGIRSALEFGLKPEEITIFDDVSGDRVSRRTILDRLAALPAGPQDTVFFYYSGHGAYIQGGHALTTSRGDVLRTEVRNAILAKNPRLAVILTDCCAVVVRRPLEPGQPGAGAPEIPPIRSLLLGHSGVVDILSSSAGEASFCSDETGGFFTSALVQGLQSPHSHDYDLDGDGFVEWEEFFPALRSRTMWLYRDFREGLLGAGQLRPSDRRALETQSDQVPLALSLGRRDDGRDAVGHTAPNLGISYELVPIGSRQGARVMKPPVAGSAAAAIALEPGDVIVSLDGLPIRHYVDVLNHSARTSIEFVNVRTGRPETRLADLPRVSNYPAGTPESRFARNLGLSYQLVPFDRGYGARVNGPPAAGSPFAPVQLERGDMIVELDDLPIYSPEDVVNHTGRTTFTFINIRTGLMQNGTVILP